MMNTEDFEFAELSDNPSRDEIENEIKRLTQLKVDNDNKNQALKIILNSIYGVAGYIYFICYDRDVAESITSQSRHLIKYTIEIYNKYFREEWHKNTKAHKALGVADVKQIKHDVINYADTDSVFFVVDKVMELCGYKGSTTDFVIKLLDNGLQEYVDNKLREYIEGFNGFTERPNGDKSLVLELEQVCKSVLWTSKKKYIKSVYWGDGIEYDPNEEIKVKGLELNQSSTPKYVREQLAEIVKFIMTSSGDIDNNKLVSKLRAIKEEFHTAPVEKIAKIERVTNYEKWIINDTTKLEVTKGAKPHVRGAGFHNYMIHKKNYDDRYDTIKSGDKVHWYYSSGTPCKSFAFLSNQLPANIAPPVDANLQFEKVFLNPLNNILSAIGIPKLNANLIIYPVLD